MPKTVIKKKMSLCGSPNICSLQNVSNLWKENAVWSCKHVHYLHPVTIIELLCKPRLSEVCRVLSNSLISDTHHSGFVTPNILTMYISGSLTLESVHPRLGCARKLQRVDYMCFAFHCLFFFFFLFEPYLRKTQTEIKFKALQDQNE